MRVGWHQPHRSPGRRQHVPAGGRTWGLPLSEGSRLRAGQSTLFNAVELYLVLYPDTRVHASVDCCSQQLFSRLGREVRVGGYLPPSTSSQCGSMRRCKDRRRNQLGIRSRVPINHLPSGMVVVTALMIAVVGEPLRVGHHARHLV